MIHFSFFVSIFFFFHLLLSFFFWLQIIRPTTPIPNNFSKSYRLLEINLYIFLFFFREKKEKKIECEKFKYARKVFFQFPNSIVRVRVECQNQLLKSLSKRWIIWCVCARARAAIRRISYLLLSIVFEATFLFSISMVLLLLCHSFSVVLF